MESQRDRLFQQKEKDIERKKERKKERERLKKERERKKKIGSTRRRRRKCSLKFTQLAVAIANTKATFFLAYLHCV